MNTGKFILVNGTFHPTDEYLISLPESEAFLFSEKIRSVRTAFPFFTETVELINLKLRIFNQSFPEFMDQDGAGLKRQLERTLTKNKHFAGAVLTIVFRFSNQKIHYSIQSAKHEDADFKLNEKGLYIAIFDKIMKPVSPLSNLSLGSEMYWTISKKHLEKPGINLPVLLNTNGMIVETPESNIYLINGNTIKGASPLQGAYKDISQTRLFELFNQLNLNYEEEGLTIQDMRAAEEIMIVNAIDGIRWIAGYEGKRFFNNTIRKISESFNQSITN